MDEQAFREQARREGFADPALVDWVADTFNDIHAHEVDCSIFVLCGDVAIATEDEDTTYHAGDTCLMARDKPHSERVGPDGVKLLVADGAAYVTGEVVTIDGGEWLEGAAQFAILENLSEAEWAAIRPMKKG